jgi:hypothetical protein
MSGSADYNSIRVSGEGTAQITLLVNYFSYALDAGEISLIVKTVVVGRVKLGFVQNEGTNV